MTSEEIIKAVSAINVLIDVTNSTAEDIFEVLEGNIISDEDCSIIKDEIVRLTKRNEPKRRTQSEMIRDIANTTYTKY